MVCVGGGRGIGGGVQVGNEGKSKDREFWQCLLQAQPSSCACDGNACFRLSAVPVLIMAMLASGSAQLLCLCPGPPWLGSDTGAKGWGATRGQRDGERHRGKGMGSDTGAKGRGATLGKGMGSDTGAKGWGATRGKVDVLSDLALWAAQPANANRRAMVQRGP
eukprot:366068-Chlamydomonas_euryale.AAC.10